MISKFFLYAYLALVSVNNKIEPTYPSFHFKNVEIKTLDIYLILNKNTSCIEWRFLYNSSDSDIIKIFRPEMVSPFSYISMFNNKMEKVTDRCLFIDYKSSKDPWISLPANTIIKQENNISLDKLFCKIENDYFLSYIYVTQFSIEKDKKEVDSGILSFEVEPTEINNIDTIKITKKIYTLR